MARTSYSDIDLLRSGAWTSPGRGVLALAPRNQLADAFLDRNLRLPAEHLFDLGPAEIQLLRDACAHLGAPGPVNRLKLGAGDLYQELDDPVERRGDAGRHVKAFSGYVGSHRHDIGAGHVGDVNVIV